MRFAKPFTVTIASAALIALPFTGSALAEAPSPQPTATTKAPQPTHSTPATKQRQDRDGQHKDTRTRKPQQQISLSASVNPSRVRAGATYSVTITTKGLSSGTATITSPEGKTYRVSLSSGHATKTLTVPSKTRAGEKSVTVKVGNKTTTAPFTVTTNKRR